MLEKLRSIQSISDATDVHRDDARLAYSTETGAEPKSYGASESTPGSEVYRAAEELADDLYDGYAAAFNAVLEKMQTSPRMREFLRQKGMDKPRVNVYTAGEYRDLAEYGVTVDEVAYEYDTLDDVSDKSVVVNFQLPKPLDIFWDKEFFEEYADDLSQAEIDAYWRDRMEDSRVMNEWGEMYRRLMGVPWRIVDDWQTRHAEKFDYTRINDLGIHANGDDGFYYLFEIYENNAAAYGKSASVPEPADTLDKYDQYDTN